jgi:formylglycine-generating enzyme required for sulfatase activity
MEKAYIILKKITNQQTIKNKNSMKKQLLSLLTIVCISMQVTMANNIAVSNVNITGQNNALQFKLINFDVAWDNSWNINIGPSNHDAAWVFVKYRLKSDNIWKHATLNWVNGTGTADGHTEPLNSDIISSNDNGANGAHGVFIRRTDIANGSVNFAGVTLRWNYGVDGLTNIENVEVRVMAIEMVYVPQSAFYLGDGTVNSYFTYPITTSYPYLINTEAAIDIGSNANGNLGYVLSNSYNYIPAAFPKGFNAFYCMKYEITQTQYVAFLNTLTNTQQTNRTLLAATTVGAAAFSTTNRNGIKVKSISATRQYGCDLNNDGIFDGAADGQSLACNFLNWYDVGAYLDWAAIRPMTEFEFEKACRGTKLPITNEYAWGDDFGIDITTLTNAGANNEIAQPNANINTANSGLNGPTRAGMFSKTGTSRIQSGASYYGIMELSGNVNEITVSPKTDAGGSCCNAGIPFTGKNGNGVLGGTGTFDVAFWPNSPSSNGTGALNGLITRGGGFNSSLSISHTVSNISSGYPNANRYSYYGGRGVRSAP